MPYTATRFAQYEEGVGQLRAAGGDLGGGSETIITFHNTQTPISDKAELGGFQQARTKSGGVEHGVIAFESTGGSWGVNEGDTSPPIKVRSGLQIASPPAVIQTLTVGGRDKGAGDSYDNTPVVVQDVDSAVVCSRGGFGGWTETNAVTALCAQDAGLSSIVSFANRPRRLIPLEYERLMSWPDNWTATGIRENGTEYQLADTVRYRLCGNGVGSVCVAWFAQRLADLIEVQ